MQDFGKRRTRLFVDDGSASRGGNWGSRSTDHLATVDDQFEAAKLSEIPLSV